MKQKRLRVSLYKHTPDPDLSDKQNKVMELIEGAESSLLLAIGGYPALVDYSISGYVIVASTLYGGNEPDLDIFTWDELYDRLERAKELHEIWRKDGDCDQYDDTELHDAWLEVGP